MHEMLHLLGIDTQQSYFYDFWSGVGAQISLFIAALSIYKRHNCHVHLCWRIGRYQVGNYNLCKRHHPDLPAKVTMEHIQFIHNQSEGVKL